jgi:hypothetical protein
MAFLKRHVDAGVAALVVLGFATLGLSMVIRSSILLNLVFGMLAGLIMVTAILRSFNRHLLHQKKESTVNDLVPSFLAATNAKASSSTNSKAWANANSIFGRSSTYSVPFTGLEAAAGGQDGSPYYCTDCGKRYVHWSRQYGFTVTGEPNHTAFYACPDWTKERMESGWGVGYNCGHLTTTEPISAAHNSHPSGEVVPSCPGCLEQMVLDGYITREQASSRMS